MAAATPKIEKSTSEVSAKIMYSPGFSAALK